MFSGMRLTARPGTRGRRAAAVAAASLALAASVASAQPGPDGIDWVTIGAPNNPAYQGPDPANRVTGRGSVPYEYRLSRTEITSAQWLEFFNAAMARPDPLPYVANPGTWGAGPDPTYHGPGMRFRLGSQATGQWGVYGITWRAAAMYCNWAHNGKSSERSAFLSGAYDLATFGDNPDGTFTDQATRSPGARYWIPSLDEWIKAAHWSPDKPTDGGWYQYSNGTDIPLTYGPPPAFGGNGTGMANARFRLMNFDEYTIPIGSYPQTTSPWGLLDMAGGEAEWTEEIGFAQGVGNYRLFDGSYAGGVGNADFIGGLGGDRPSESAGSYGLRLAAPIASPGGCGILGVFVCISHRTVRTRSHESAGGIEVRGRTSTARV